MDEKVAAARLLLERLILARGWTRQDVDRKLGLGDGYTSRLLAGGFKLTYAHMLQILEAIGVEPELYFQTLHGNRRRSPQALLIEDLRAALAAVGGAKAPPARQEEPARDEVAELEERMLQAIEHLYRQQGLAFDPDQ